MSFQMRNPSTLSSHAPDEEGGEVDDLAAEGRPQGFSGFFPGTKRAYGMGQLPRPNLSPFDRQLQMYQNPIVVGSAAVISGAVAGAVISGGSAMCSVGAPICLKAAAIGAAFSATSCSSGAFLPVADNGICELPEVIVPSSVSVSEGAIEDLLKAISLLPSEICTKVKKIEIIDDDKRFIEVFTGKIPGENWFQMNGGFSRLDENLSLLGLHHLGSPAGDIIYDATTSTIYLTDSPFPRRRELIHMALIGYGLAIRTPELVDHILEEITTLGESVALDLFGLHGKAFEEVDALFPHVFGFYAMSGHVVRMVGENTKQIEKAASKSQKQSIREAAGYVERLPRIHKLLKDVVFAGKEFQTSEDYADLANADLQTMHKALKGEVETMESPSLEAYRRVAFSRESAQKDIGVVLFAQERLRKVFHSSQGDDDLRRLFSFMLQCMEVADEAVEVARSWSLVFEIGATLIRARVEDPENPELVELAWQTIEKIAELHSVEESTKEDIAARLFKELMFGAENDGCFHFYQVYPGRRDALLPHIRRLRRLCEKLTKPDHKIRTRFSNICSIYPEMCTD